MRAVLDRAALRAANVFDAPMAMVTLVDEHEAVWQGAAGIDRHAPDVPRRQPRQDLPCHWVVADRAALFIEDIDRDPRLADSHARQTLGLRSYAGAPLVTTDGEVIGVLCVIDRRPRSFGESERALLQTMAVALMSHLARLRASARRRRARGQVQGPRERGAMPLALPETDVGPLGRASAA